jgi:hypothetical protein
MPPTAAEWVEAMAKMGGWGLAGYLVVRIVSWALDTFDKRIADVGMTVSKALDGVKAAVEALDRGQRENSQAVSLLVGTTKEVGGEVRRLGDDVRGLSTRFDNHLEEHHS